MLGICFRSPCVMFIAPYCYGYVLDRPVCDTYRFVMLGICFRSPCNDICIFVMLGIRFRSSCMIFIAPYFYGYALDRPVCDTYGFVMLGICLRSLCI